MTTAKAITSALLRDRERRNQKRAAPRSSSRAPADAFDPFAVTRWRVIGGGDPGYLPTLAMRRGPVGWFIRCVGCGKEFESVLLAHCGETACRAAANARKSTIEGYTPKPIREGARLCACGCGRAIPRYTPTGRLTSKATRFFSDACSAKSRRIAADSRQAVLSPEKAPETRIKPTSAEPLNLIGGHRWAGAKMTPLASTVLQAELSGFGDLPVVASPPLVPEMPIDASARIKESTTPGDPGPIPDFLDRAGWHDWPGWHDWLATTDGGTP
jgi:hypothetical protein